MKVRKIVELSQNKLLMAVRKLPGLNRAQKVIIRNYYGGSVVDNARVEVEWVEDEVIDGIAKE